MKSIISAKDLTFEYKNDVVTTQILKAISFDIRESEFVGIYGPSGSGKSTLFYLLGALLAPTSGSIAIDETELSLLDANKQALFRNQRIGFVFQQFHLLPRTSVLENILLPCRYPDSSQVTDAEIEKAKTLAKRVGLGELLDRMPNQLSGGQQQRVAIARALMRDVSLILADEPTGNLDSETALDIMNILKELNREGKTIVLITHDPEISQHCTRTIFLKDGKIQKDSATDLGVERAKQKLGSPASVEKFSPDLKLTTAPLPKLIAMNLLPALQNLKRNKLKSMLTMLGVTIGIASVLSMVTFGGFTKRKVLESYTELGSNQLVLSGWPNWNRQAIDKVDLFFTAFTVEDDIKPLRRIFKDIHLISPRIRYYSASTLNFSGMEYNERILIYGVNSEYFKLMNHKLAVGHFFNEYQIESKSPVCIIGYDIAKRLFKNSPPLEQLLNVSPQSGTPFPCLVIGVLEKMNATDGNSSTNSHVYIPYTFFPSAFDEWNSAIREIFIDLKPGADIERMGIGVKRFFTTKYGKTGNFWVNNNAIILSQMNKFLTLFSLMLTAIALISLLVGGIGINNMMLVSVTERLKEIGLRKALGATNHHIRIQLLTESTLLSVIGGFIGAVMGFSTYELIIFGASKVVDKIQFEWIIDVHAILYALVSMLVVGIGSGLAPALKAEKLQVIEALRSE